MLSAPKAQSHGPSEQRGASERAFLFHDGETESQGEEGTDHPVVLCGLQSRLLMHVANTWGTFNKMPTPCDVLTHSRERVGTRVA